MENPEPEKSSAPEESSSLNRNRSFKSKQLVRSQAIRESQSPPRTVSPAVEDTGTGTVTDVDTGTYSNSTSNAGGNTGDVAGGVEEDREEKRRPVEIQITGGSLDSSSLRVRRRWPQQRDLLSHAPRVACVAGCRHSHHCRGQRRRHPCPTKQDSGISCPDDCAETECSHFEPSGGSGGEVRKACSLDSDDTYCRCPERRDEKPKNNLISRTESADSEKVEPTGPELVNFIKDTLNKNPRDRMTLLKIEKELHSLVTDTGRCMVKFPMMSSYGRMLVHRAAALFQLAHHVDPAARSAVTVSKSGTSGGRLPCTSFRRWCTASFPPGAAPHAPHHDANNAKSILKRDTHSPDESGASCRAVERSKSLEQREKDYERVRRRIFSSDNCSQDESQWPWLNSGPVKLLTPETGRNKLLKVQSLESSGGGGQTWRCRGAVSKSHSFGGYGGEPRLLSRQGDLAASSWRLSPSSSGYKTLSLRSCDSATPSPTGGASPEPTAEGAVVWAVTDLSSVPPGALVIHPQTGRPLTNPDGSVYHFDPSNPPVIYDANAYIQDHKIPNSEKRRGRLEKQHSFVDAECRCDDGRTKCCCECRRHDTCNRSPDEKLATPTQQKTLTIPPSPVKNRYEPNAEPTNQSTPPEPPANHRPYEANRPVEPANQRTENIPSEQAFDAPNQFEKRTELETVQRQYKSPKTFENRTFTSPHQRPPSYDPNNQRGEAANQTAPMSKLTNQESVEMPQYAQSYSKGFRNDEVTSPQIIQNHAILQPDVGLYNMMAQTKIAHIPVQDPNLRPVSLTNMIYPAPMTQAYPYVNQARMDQPLQPVYQPMMHEEQKMAPSSHSNDTTFRIDPSYPYAPLQYGPACATCAGACLDPGGQHQRYNVGYGQMEQAGSQQPYPGGGVLLQHNVQHYPYQEAMQWANPMQIPAAPAKLLMHELCPVYPQYPYVYPQMLPQPYPMVQPLCPAVDTRPKRGSAPGSHRATPLPDQRERRDSDIATKIQQIKEQMAQLSTQDKQKSGNGLLGNAPVANYNGRAGRPVHDERQLSSAARAIVNSIRNMQTYQHDNRRQYGETAARERRHERDDRRRAPEPRQQL